MFHKRFLPILAFLTLFFFGFFPLLSQAYDPFSFNPKTIEVNENLLFPRDSAIGSMDAPVTIVDYSSFSCTHCKAAFENLILPTYENYVKTGKVVLIMRDFPLDNLSFNASVFLECYRRSKTTDEKEVVALIGKLFDLGSQAKNKGEADAMFENILLDSDLTKSEKTELRSCMNNLDVKDIVLYSKLFAIKELGIGGTPLIFINGEKYTGPFKFSSFSGKLDKILSGKNRY